MAKLIFSLDNAILNEFPLENERTTIGRRPTNDIQIDNLAVSGEHAVILKMGDDFYIEDLESTNGTEVNAKLVKSHQLQPGDVIIFGKHQLKFISEAKSEEQNIGDSAFEKTLFIRPNEVKDMMQSQTQTTPISVQLVTPAPDSGAKALAAAFVADVPPPVIATGRIQVLNGSSVGRELVLNKALTTLGKTGVQVAVITKRPLGYFVTHVEGKVFPIVNGNSTGAQAFELSDHDVIELAGVKMEFYFDKV
jgi:pSer/pThr/pTyr-binding forkhead associated (FHA) protein